MTDGFKPDEHQLRAVREFVREFVRGSSARFWAKLRYRK